MTNHMFMKQDAEIGRLKEFTTELMNQIQGSAKEMETLKGENREKEKEIESLKGNGKLLESENYNLKGMLKQHGDKITDKKQETKGSIIGWLSGKKDPEKEAEVV